MAEFLARLMLANMVASVLILLVLGLRRPVRRTFGARIAYGLWALPLLGVLGGLLPAPVRIVHLAPAVHAASPVEAGPGLWPLVFGLWLAGAAGSVVWLALAQRRFLRDAARGEAGPAVAGVLRPRIITPADFEARYTPRERTVVMAHEAMHLERQDARVNALAAAARCLNWFNPLVYVAVFHLRADQELACDAQVVARHPTARRTYAEAMLKTQLAAHPLPLGCYWPGKSDHPLTERIAMLTAAHPGPGRGAAGVALVAALALAAALVGWGVQPARSRAAAPVVATQTPAPAKPSPIAARPLTAPAPRLQPAAPTAPAVPAIRPDPVISPEAEAAIAHIAEAEAHRFIADNHEQIAALAASAAIRGLEAAGRAATHLRTRQAAGQAVDVSSEVDRVVNEALAGLDERIEREVAQALANIPRDHPTPRPRPTP